MASELNSTVGPRLAQRGYKLVASGPAGLTWRRERPQWSWLAVGLLAFFALGGIASGLSEPDAGSVVVGLAFAAGAVAVFLWRRPGAVSLRFTPDVNGGTNVAVEGDDASRVNDLLRVALGDPGTAGSAPLPSGWQPPQSG